VVRICDWCLMLPNYGRLCDFIVSNSTNFSRHVTTFSHSFPPPSVGESSTAEPASLDISIPISTYFDCIISHKFISAQLKNALLFVSGFTNELRPQQLFIIRAVRRALCCSLFLYNLRRQQLRRYSYQCHSVSYIKKHVQVLISKSD
jgi:hypothetical protein